eukprot:13527566-Alexandrium_andersonii.AAC.1
MSEQQANGATVSAALEQRTTVAAEPAHAHRPGLPTGSGEAIGTATPEQRTTVVAEPAHAHRPGLPAWS